MTNSEFLKEKTKHLHDATEERMGARRIFSSNYSMDEYKSLLLKMYQPYSVVEKALNAYHDPKIQSVLADTYTQKANFLESDLAQMGVSHGQPAGKINFSSPAEAMGALYVLKGSDMGATIINKALERTSKGWESPAFSFYQSEKDPKSSWAAYKTHLDAMQLDEKGRNELLNGAEKAFSLFQ